MDRFDKHDGGTEESLRKAVEFLGTFDRNTAWQMAVYQATLHAEAFIDIADDSERIRAILSSLPVDVDTTVARAKQFLRMLHLNGENDHYLTLLLARDAGPVEINRRWKALMRIYHPDRKQDGGEEELECAKRINDAYSVLKKSGEKEKYDRKRVREAVLISRSHQGMKGGNAEGRRIFRKTIVPACVVACCLVIAVILYNESRKDEEFRHESVFSQTAPVQAPPKEGAKKESASQEISVSKSGKTEPRATRAVVQGPASGGEPSKQSGVPVPVSSGDSRTPAIKGPSANYGSPKTVPSPERTVALSPPKNPPAKSPPSPVTEQPSPPEKKAVIAPKTPVASAKAGAVTPTPKPQRPSSSQTQAPQVSAPKQTVATGTSQKKVDATSAREKPGLERKNAIQASAAPPAAAVPGTKPGPVTASSSGPAKSTPLLPQSPAPAKTGYSVPNGGSGKEISDTRTGAAAQAILPQPTHQDRPEKKDKPGPDATRIEVTQFVGRYTRAYESGDINQFIRFYSRKALENNTLDYPAIRAAYEKSFEKYRFQYGLKDMEFQKQGDAIIVHGGYHITRSDKGEKREIKGRITWVLKHEDGVLKIVKADYNRL